MTTPGNTDGDGAASGWAFLPTAAAEEDLAASMGSAIVARSSRDEIRSVLRPICVHARQSQLDIAELVKLVKRSFAASALASSLVHAGERQQALDRIISVCIDEYYESS
jgi:hypothetical protein